MPSVVGGTCLGLLQEGGSPPSGSRSIRSCLLCRNLKSAIAEPSVCAQGRSSCCVRWRPTRNSAHLWKATQHFRPDGEPTNGYSTPISLGYLQRARLQFVMQDLGFGGFCVWHLLKRQWTTVTRRLIENSCGTRRIGWNLITEQKNLSNHLN